MASDRARQQSAAVELFWKIHPVLYRWSGGRLGDRLMGMPVLLLSTRGRRTGRERTCALLYHATDSAFVVIASKLGGPSDPEYAVYAERTSREIPVVVLERR